MTEEEFNLKEENFYIGGWEDARDGEEMFVFKHVSNEDWQFIYDAGYQDYLESTR